MRNASTSDAGVVPRSTRSERPQNRRFRKAYRTRCGRRPRLWTASSRRRTTGVDLAGMTTRTPDIGVVRTQVDLAELWHSFMGPGRFALRTLWILAIDDTGRALPPLLPIDDLPPRPNGFPVDSIKEIIEVLVREVAADTVACLISRPGRSAVSADDRAWAGALRAVSARWPVHLATADRITVIAVDDAL